MSPLQNLVTVLYVLSGSLQIAEAGPVRRQEQALQARDDVAACELVLIALKATSFCSSFVGVHDSTKTAIATGPSKTALTTVPAPPCTVTAPANTITSTTTYTAPVLTVSSYVTLAAVTSTTTIAALTPTDTSTLTSPGPTSTATETTVVLSTVTSTTTVAAVKLRRESPEQMGLELVARVPKVTSSSRSTTCTNPVAKTTAPVVPVPQKAVSTPGSCTLKGLPPKVTPFVCNVISQACSRIVRPKTVTITTTAPGETKFSTATAPQTCTTLTPPPVIVQNTATAPGPSITITTTITPDPVVLTETTTPAAVVVFETMTLPVITSTTTVTSTSVATTTTTIVSAPIPVQCTGGTYQGSGVFSFGYNSFCDSVCQPQGPPNILLGSTTATNFQGCINFCDSFAVITLANFDGFTGSCTCTFTGGNAILAGQTGKFCAVAQGSGVSGS